MVNFDAEFQNLKAKQLFQKITFFVTKWCENYELQFDMNKLDNMNEIEQQNLLKEWNDAFCKDLDSKKVKYANPVTRILGKSANIYIACDYRDMNALKDSVSFKLFDDIQLFCNYDKIEETEDKASIWKVISSINADMFDYFEISPPKTPSRQELQENIKQHKMSRLPNAQPSMHKAVQMCMIKIAEELNLSDFKQEMELLTDEDLDQMCDEIGNSQLQTIMNNLDTNIENFTNLSFHKISRSHW